MTSFRAQGIVKNFGGVKALQGVDLEVGDGSVVGILGPNGSGKTTLFNLATGINAPTSGSFTFDGTDVTGWPAYRIAQAGIIRTFQNLRLFRDLTCLENVKVGAHRNSTRSLTQAVLRTRAERRAERDIEERAKDLVARVGLHSRRDNYAANLSYGQMKRLEIARAMAAEPKLLLLDEPAAGINDTQAHEVLGLVMDLAAEHSISVIIVEHNVRALLAIATDVYVLDAGKVVFHGEPSAVASSPSVIEAYLGTGGER